MKREVVVAVARETIVGVGLLALFFLAIYLLAGLFIFVLYLLLVMAGGS